MWVRFLSWHCLKPVIVSYLQSKDKPLTDISQAEKNIFYFIKNIQN